MMRAGLTPWDMPVKHYRMFAECYTAEAELAELEQKKQASRQRSGQRSKR